MSTFEIMTSRLLLREWRDEDLEHFAEMNADQRVMEYFPAPLSRNESDALVGRFQEEFARKGFCPFAAVERESNEFIGFVGLHEVNASLSFAPAVEVGWRLAQPYWGRGFATEGATASLDLAFGELGLDDVVSMTSRLNHRSSRVMDRLGMTTDPKEDFEHASIEVGHELRPHVLYRLDRASWASRTATARATSHDGPDVR